MVRSETLYVVDHHCLTAHELYTKVASLMGDNGELHLEVEHEGDDGQLRAVSLIFIRMDGQSVFSGELDGITRGSIAEKRKGWKFDGWVHTNNPHDSIPAFVQLHFRAMVGGSMRPVFGSVDLKHELRPRLFIPHDGPLTR